MCPTAANGAQRDHGITTTFGFAVESHRYRAVESVPQIIPFSHRDTPQAYSKFATIPCRAAIVSIAILTTTYVFQYSSTLFEFRVE